MSSFSYPSEYKVSVLKLIQSGCSKKYISQNFMPVEDTVDRWIKNEGEISKDSSCSEDMVEMHKEILSKYDECIRLRRSKKKLIDALCWFIKEYQDFPPTRDSF